MEEVNILEESGLTLAESKIYFALIDLGTTQIGDIISATKLSPSAVHNSLKSLQEKGLVGSILRGKVKQYNSADPKVLLRLMDEKRKKVEELVPKLIVKRKKESSEYAEIYEGYNGLATAFSESLEFCTPGSEVIYFAASAKYRNEKMEMFYRSLNLKLKERKISSKGLHPIQDKGMIKNTDIIQVKFIEQILPPDMTIIKDRIIMVRWGDEPRAVLIKSEQIADQYRRMWHTLWDKTK